MKTRLLFFFVLIALSVYATPPAEEGKTIFTARCAACHNVNKVLVGPALAGVDQRRSIDWIINFVQSSQSVIKKGDKDAVALFEKFNKIQMPDHPDLTADNIKSIVEYIQSEAQTAANKENKLAASGPEKSKSIFDETIELLKKDTAFQVIVSILLLLLIASLLLWLKVRVMIQNRNIRK